MVFFASDFSVRGYRDRGFGREVRWNDDLLAGYRSTAASSRPISPVFHLATPSFLDSLFAWRPEACLVNAYFPLMYPQSILACNRAGVPVIMRAEATDESRVRSPAKRWLRDAILRTLYRRVAAFASIGRNASSHYRRLGVPDHRIVHSPYCVDTVAFEQRLMRLSAGVERGRQGTPRDAVVVLFSGKLIPVKDPAIILEALRGLESIDGKPVHVWFMGDGELKETLEELAHRCLPQRVRFLGFRSQDQMADVYADADILVLPSEGETWGLVVNEALMFGVPCVVSDRVGCAPDLIDPGASGLVFPQGNAAALRDAIVRMTRALGSARDAVARQCRQRVSRYSSHAAAEGIAEAVRLARAGASEI